MLDKIQNTASEAILQNKGISSISQLGMSNPYEVDDKNYFVDECDISTQALEKFQKELDIKNFSEVFMNTSEKEANSLVLSKGLEGSISFDSEDILSSLLNNQDFLDDLYEEDDN